MTAALIPVETDRFRSNEVDVAALQITIGTDSSEEILRFCRRAHARISLVTDPDHRLRWVSLRAAAGMVDADDGDWLVITPDGQLHLIREDLFSVLFD